MCACAEPLYGSSNSQELVTNDSHLSQPFTPLPRTSLEPLRSPDPDTFVLVSRPKTSATYPASTERHSLSHRLQTANKLFEFASGLSLVQHPLCQECADDLLVRLERRVGSVRKERDAYAAFLETLEGDEDGSQVGESQEEVQLMEEVSKVRFPCGEPFNHLYNVQ